MQEFSYLQNPENVRSYSSYCIENATHYSLSSRLKCDPIWLHIPIAFLLESTPPPTGEVKSQPIPVTNAELLIQIDEKNEVNIQLNDDYLGIDI